MERAIQIFAVIQLAVIGLSHIVQPRVWVDFFVRLREKGEAGVFFVGFMSLGFGSLVVAFHDVWTGIPIVLTLLGWAQVLKGTAYFLWPRYGLRRMAFVEPERARFFLVPGVALLVLAALLAYHLLTTAA